MSFRISVESVAFLKFCWHICQSLKPVLKLIRSRGVAPDENEIAMISGLLLQKIMNMHNRGQVVTVAFVY